MEDNNSVPREEELSPKPIETDYESHSDDPGPSRPAVVEKDKNGAGSVLRWILPLAVIIGMVIWFLMRK